MIYMWFTGTNYYKLAVEKDRDSIFTTTWPESRFSRPNGNMKKSLVATRWQQFTTVTTVSSL